MCAHKSNIDYHQNQQKQSLINSFDKNQKKAVLKSVISKLLNDLSVNNSGDTQQTQQQSNESKLNNVKSVVKSKIVRKRHENQSTREPNAKTMVSIGVQSDLDNHFDVNEALKDVPLDMSDEYTQKLYNELLRQNREQNMVLSALKEQLNTELTKLEMAKTHSANVMDDYERKIIDYKRSNWCTNCSVQIRQNDSYSYCCYDAIYCGRECRRFDWLNGHQNKCTKK